MAYSIDRTVEGFHFIYNAAGHIASDVRAKALVLTPNTSFYKGDAVIMTNGRVARAAANSTDIIGVMVETVLAADNPAASETTGMVHIHEIGDVYEVNFKDAIDFDADGGSLTTVETASADVGDGNDRHNGAFLLCYASTTGNKGLMRIVSDYVSATKTFTVLPDYNTAVAAGDSFIVFGCKTVTAPIGQLTRGMLIKVESTEMNIDVDGDISSEEGPCVLVGWDDALAGVFRVTFNKNIMAED